MADPIPPIEAMVARFRGHRLDSRILTLFLAFSVGALSLLWLCSEILEGESFVFDRTLLLATRLPSDTSVMIGPSWLESAMVAITNLGGGATLTIVTVIAVGALFAWKKWKTAAALAILVKLGTLLSWQLKMFFARPRPDVVPHLVKVSSASFPSGHSMNSAIVFLTLAILVARTQQRRATQVYLICSAIFLVVLIGISRVFLGVHWPSDVIFGWSVGAVWAVMSSLVLKSLQQHHAIEKAPRDSTV